MDDETGARIQRDEADRDGNDGAWLARSRNAPGPTRLRRLSVVITVWRVVRASYEQTAFDGAGARALGGRWSSPGTSVVYTSQSVSLATLEILVHTDRRAALQSFSIVSGTFFDESIVEVLDDARLPRDWRAAPDLTKKIGDE